MNPAEWLNRTATLHPDNPALFLGDDLIATYSEFRHNAVSIALELKNNHGINAGDRVAIALNNSPQYLELLYGIWWIGALAVPVNAKLHAREIGWILDNCKAKLLFTSQQLSEELVECDLANNITIITPEQSASWYQKDQTLSPVIMQPDDLVWLFYTSGTTGRPKGVMITSANILGMIAGYHCDIHIHQESDTTLYAAPMSHGAGLYNFMHVMAGSKHVIPKSGGFEPDEIFDLFDHFSNISMFCAPTMVKRLVDYKKSADRNTDGLETIIYAGGPMYFADIVEAVDEFGPKFVQIYGQGECPMAITVLKRDEVSNRTHKHWQERLNSVGHAQMHVCIKIADAQMNELPVGEIGEILVHSTSVMKGYWQNEDATSQTIIDGWLKTGDMGAIDSDGFLTLHDRSKDVIISGGSNIYPREVEEILLTHPDIQEVSIVGKPDPEWGEIVVAFVVSNKAQQLDVSSLDQMCLEHIARFKRPKEYIFLDQLPKNNYGKVLKTELRSRFN